MLWSCLYVVLFPGSGTYCLSKSNKSSINHLKELSKNLSIWKRLLFLCAPLFSSPFLHLIFLSFFPFLHFLFPRGDSCAAHGQLWHFIHGLSWGWLGQQEFKTKAQEHLCSFDCSRKTQKAQHVQRAKCYGEMSQQFSKIALVGHSTGTIREQALARACLHSPGRASSDFAVGNVQCCDCGLGVIGSVCFAASCFL